MPATPRNLQTTGMAGERLSHGRIQCHSDRWEGCMSHVRTPCLVTAQRTTVPARCVLWTSTTLCLVVTQLELNGICSSSPYR
jgi:hypothetical protein